MSNSESDNSSPAATSAAHKKMQQAGRVLKITSLITKDTETKTKKKLLKFTSAKVTHDDIVSYKRWLNNRKKGDNSFNDFLTKRNSTTNSPTIIVIADFSNLTINNLKSRELLDLKGANFIGSIFHNTHFSGCDLRNAKFCGVHLDKVFFKESNINFVDFSRADLSSCNFDKSYCSAPWNGIEGIKFSSTVSCIRVYADIKNEIAKKMSNRDCLIISVCNWRELGNILP